MKGPQKIHYLFSDHDIIFVIAVVGISQFPCEWQKTNSIYNKNIKKVSLAYQDYQLLFKLYPNFPFKVSNSFSIYTSGVSTIAAFSVFHFRLWWTHTVTCLISQQRMLQRLSHQPLQPRHPQPPPYGCTLRGLRMLKTGYWPWTVTVHIKGLNSMSLATSHTKKNANLINFRRLVFD